VAALKGKSVAAGRLDRDPPLRERIFQDRLTEVLRL